MSNYTLLEEKRIRAMIHTIQGIGSGKLRQLIARFGSAYDAWNHIEEDQQSKEEMWLHQIIHKRKELDPAQVEERLYNQGINIIIPEEDGYPDLLRQLTDAPPLLYYKGHLSSGKESLAIVGARKATPYGRAAAESLAKEIAGQGIAVVSGLARGIDTAAHRGALAADRGITWAVMGCGLNFMYPPENQKLADEIIENGGALWSEFAPEMPPEPQLFPMRNRLISGMSRGVVVVEAALKSGALITVDFALEQGREVFAVPGPIFNPMSKGPNHLIRQGAKIIEGFEDIQSEIPFFTEGNSSKSTKLPRVKAVAKTKQEEKLGVSNEQEKILQMLSDTPTHIDQITMSSEVPPEQIPLALLELQLAGRIEQLPGQLYVLAYKC